MDSQIAQFPDEVLIMPDGEEKIRALLKFLDGTRSKITPENREALAESLFVFAEQVGHVSGQARAIMHVANSYSDRANYNKAIHLHMRAMQLLESTEDYRMLASVHNDLATVYFRLKREGEAKTHLNKAIEVSKNTGNAAMAATFSLNLAVTDISALEGHVVSPEDFDRIAELLQYAKTTFSSILDANPDTPQYALYLAAACQTMGRLNELDVETSLAHHREALSIMNRYELQNKSYTNHLSLAELLVRLDRPIEATEHFLRAVQYAEEQKDFFWFPAILQKTSQFYEAQGDFREALSFLQRLNTANDHIRVTNTNDQLEKLQSHFEAERKAKDAEIYQLRFVELEQEKKKSDDLLLNILPKETAEELKETGVSEAKQFDSVTVLFTDFKGFTQMSETLSPKDLVRDLHECFSAFDHICQKHGMEKIKTIGDAYMAAGGLPTVNTTHAVDAIKAALEMRDFATQGKARKQAAGLPFFEIRIGLHTGPVVAGIVGIKKFQYDIWGDTVNTASRMESSGEVGKVNISESTYHLVKNEFDCEFRGEVEAKGKGKMGMYFVYGQLK